MANDRFKDKMKRLEQEREDFIGKLTPEDQQEYQQKEEEYSRKPESSGNAAGSKGSQEIS
jgi:hypothetical protein